jgi:predicted ester cyclase
MKATCILGSVFILVILMFTACSQSTSETEYGWQMDQYLKYWNTGDFTGIETVLHPEFELRMTPKYEAKIGIEAFKADVAYWRQAYPDFTIKEDEVIWGKNAAAVRWTITATNTGEGQSPPTGKQVIVPGMSILHFSDGKIKDEWIASNNGYWMEQLGYTWVVASE